MNLIGKKVYLRELREKDMSFLNKLINDPEIEHSVVGWSKPVSMSEQNNWFQNLKNDSNIRYAITDVKDVESIIGTCIISKIDWKNKNCSIDIKISSEFQGKGYGYDSLFNLVKYIFDELNMNRIYVNILDYNLGSQKLFEKMGFIEEGVQRQAVYKNGKYNSLLIYGLLKDDYYERNR